jgi:hypothetical protein
VDTVKLYGSDSFNNTIPQYMKALHERGLFYVSTGLSQQRGYISAFCKFYPHYCNNAKVDWIYCYADTVSNIVYIDRIPTLLSVINNTISTLDHGNGYKLFNVPIDLPPLRIPMYLGYRKEGFFGYDVYYITYGDEIYRIAKGKTKLFLKFNGTIRKFYLEGDVMYMIIDEADGVYVRTYRFSALAFRLVREIFWFWSGHSGENGEPLMERPLDLRVCGEHIVVLVSKGDKYYLRIFYKGNSETYLALNVNKAYVLELIDRDLYVLARERGIVLFKYRLNI